MILTLAIENNAISVLEMCNPIKVSVLTVLIHNILSTLLMIIETTAMNKMTMEVTSCRVEEK